MDCKYNLFIPNIGVCCKAYYESIRKDGKKWMHFPICTEAKCPLVHSELLEGATLESKEVNGCKYCTKYEDLPEHIIDGEPVGRVFDTCIQTDENGLWHLETTTIDIGIKFCPYCGRELMEENCEHF